MKACFGRLQWQALANQQGPMGDKSHILPVRLSKLRLISSSAQTKP
jgi:hypothetical protein